MNKSTNKPGKIIENEKKEHNKTQQTIDNHFIESREILQTGNWKYSFDENILYCNTQFSNILDIPHKDTHSNIHHIKKLFTRNNNLKFNSFTKQILSSTDTLSFVFHIVISDGSSRYVEVRSKLLHNKQNKAYAVTGILLDITNSYYNANILRKNEKLFKNLFDNHTDIFIVFEPVKDKNNTISDFVFKNVNEAYVQKFETDRNEIINQNLSSQEQLFEQFFSYFKITALTGEPQQDRFFIQSVDLFVDALIYAPDENTIATVLRDVSLIVKTDISLRENEEKYRQIFSIVNDGVLMVDAETSKILDVNPTGCTMLGANKEELLTKRFDDISDKPEMIHEQNTQNLTEKISFKLIRTDQTEINIEASISHFNWSGRKVAIVSMRDISQRIEKQKELILREKKYKQLFEHSDDAILILRNYRISDYNKQTNKLFASKENALINKTFWNISPTHQQNGDDSRLKIIEYMQQALLGKHMQFNWLFMTNNKSYFFADIKLSSILLDDEKVIYAIVRDISPKKQIEDNLKLREQRWQYALEASNTGIWEWNIETNDVFFSDTWKKMLGYENDEIQNKFEEFEKRIHPDDAARVYNQIQLYLDAKTDEFNIVFRFRTKNGSFKWINAHGKIFSFNAQGKPERFIGTHTDISRYIIKQTNNKREIEKLKNASAMIKMGFWNLDLRSMCFNGSPETFSLFGFENTTSLTSKQIEQLMHPEDQNLFMAQFIENDTDKPRKSMFRIITNNTTKFISSYASAVYSQNQLVGFDGVFQDITDIKSEELGMKERNNLANTYIEKSDQTIIIVQEDELAYANNNFKKLIGYELGEFKKLNMQFPDIITPEDKPLTQKMIDNILKNERQKERGQIRVLSKQNNIKWIDIQIIAIKYHGQKSALIMASDITKQKETEIEALIKNKQLLTFFNQSTEAMLIIDNKQRIKIANKQFYKLTESSEKQITNSSVKDVFSDEGFFNYDEIMSKIFAGNLKQYESELMLQNGIWVNALFIPDIPKENTSIKKCYLFLNNIDIAKKQIDMLTEESYMLKSVFERSVAGIGVFDTKGNLIIHNDSLLKIQDIQKKNDSNISYQNLSIIYKGKPVTIDQVMALDAPLSFDQIISPTKVIYFEITKIDLLSSQAIMVINRDITGPYTQSKAITSNFRRFERLFQLSPIGTALLDKNRNIVLCNSQYANTLGYTQNELHNQRIDMLIGSEKLTKLITDLSELFAGVTSHIDITSKMQHKLEYSVQVHSTITAFTDSFKDVQYAIQTITDISDTVNKQNQENIQNRIDVLNTIGNCYAVKIHQTLQTVYANAQHVYSTNQNAHIGSYMNQLMEKTIDSSNATNNLLIFSEQMQKLRIPVNISESIGKVILKLKIPDNIAIQTKYNYSNENIIADKIQIETAIENILLNAIESISKEGEIVIDVQSVYFDSESSHPGLNVETGKYLRIQIVDNGKGIKAENMPKIFDPFYSNKKDSSIRGLGLTIALNVAEMHGGTIKIDSTSSKGTVCTMYLKCQDPDQMDWIKPDEYFVQNTLANILLIDDEEVIRKVSANLLKKMGYNVLAFSDAQNALKYYKMHYKNIDITIVDKQMPTTDGIQIIHKIQSINPNGLAVLLCSNTENTEKLKLPTNTKSVQKPVSIEKLSDSICYLLNNKKS